jgi:hypothetical protein
MDISAMGKSYLDESQEQTIKKLDVLAKSKAVMMIQLNLEDA